MSTYQQHINIPLSISIALCTYRGKAYLHEQLESIINQTRAPNEVIICDDASDDGTMDLLTAFKSKASEKKIRTLISQNLSNEGYVKNFTRALRRTSGDIVFLCDQDDIWHAEKINVFCKEFERRPELVMLHSDADLVDAKGVYMGSTLFSAFEISRREIDAVHNGNAFEVLIRRNIVTGATMAIRRKLIDKGFEVPPGWIHDEWLAIVASINGVVDCLEFSTIDYRQHDKNQVGAKPRNIIARITAGGVARTIFMKRMLLRTQSLMDEVAKNNIFLSEIRMKIMHERLDHAKLRANLPNNLFERTIVVMKEYGLGRYRRFSNGLYSALSDLSKIRG